VFPWLLALVMYCGTFLNSLTTWSGLFLVVPLNFMLPCALFLLQDHEVAPKAPKGGYGAIELTGDGGEGGGNGDGGGGSGRSIGGGPAKVVPWYYGRAAAAAVFVVSGALNAIAIVLYFKTEEAPSIN